MVYFVVSLQGIANRERPRLYLLTTLALFEMETHGYPGIYKGPHPEMRNYFALLKRRLTRSTLSPPRAKNR